MQLVLSSKRPLTRFFQRFRLQRLVFSFAKSVQQSSYKNQNSITHIFFCAFCNVETFLSAIIALVERKYVYECWLPVLTLPPCTPTIPDLLRPDNSPASYHYETTVGGALPVISTLQVRRRDTLCVGFSRWAPILRVLFGYAHLGGLLVNDVWFRIYCGSIFVLGSATGDAFVLSDDRR